MVRRNQPDGGNNGHGRKYKDYIASKPPSPFGTLTPLEIRDQIYEMEMVSDSCNCSNRQKPVLIVRQLKTGVLSWWKLLADTMPKGEASNMPWEYFLVHLKREYCSERDLIEINNEFQNLKKGKMHFSEYVASFIKKMKLVPYLVPTELSQTSKFAIDYQWNLVPR